MNSFLIILAIAFIGYRAIKMTQIRMYMGFNKPLLYEFLPPTIFMVFSLKPSNTQYWLEYCVNSKIKTI